MKLKLLVICVMWSLCFSAVSATKLPVESFAALKSFSRLQLSPNGENLAFVRNVEGELVLMVYNTKDASFKPILKSDDHTIFFDWYNWANDDVLLLGARYIKRQRDDDDILTPFTP